MADVVAPPMDRPGGGFVFCAWLCLLSAFAVSIFGVYRMYTYDDSDKVVGGDAFNYTILATRGVGLVAFGIVLAVVGVLFSVLSLREEMMLAKRNLPLPIIAP